MRGSLVSVLLTWLLFLAGHPGLADNQSTTAKTGTASFTGSKSAGIEIAPPDTSSAKEAAGRSPSTTSAAAAAGTRTALETPSASADVPTAAPLEPHKRPVPAGYAEATLLFTQHKFADAEKEFEKIVQSGTADVNTHLCLAHCFLQQKIYSKAIKEFDWLAKYANNSMTLQASCEHTARSLRNAMIGVCPANCIKGNDPRWALQSGKKVIVFPHVGGGHDTFAPEDIGKLIVFEHGNAVLKGTCPVCEGTTRIPVLKDGGPMPRI